MEKVSKKDIERFKRKGITLAFTGYIYYLIHKEDTYYDMLVYNKSNKLFDLHINIFPDLIFYCENKDKNRIFKELKSMIKTISDDRLVFALNLKYFRVEKEKLTHYSNLDKIKYIPLSSNKQKFIVDHKTITKEIEETLNKSGYIWLHTPYFAMRGKTHDYHTICFNHKSIINSAPITSKNVIAYKDFFAFVEKEFYS